MAPVRSVKSASTFSSRVTLYEPVHTPAVAAAAATSEPTSSPSRRRSSRLSGVKLEGDARDEELFKPEWVNAENEAVEEQKPKIGAKSPRKPKKHVEALEKPHPAPKRWEETYEVIRKQRET